MEQKSYRVAIIKPKPPIHLEIQTHRANPVGVLRSSYRQAGVIKHQNHGRITGLSLDQLKLIQAAFRGEVLPKGSPQAFETLASKEYGASSALLHLARELELDRAIYSRQEPWVRDCLAMIVGRVVYAGSKLALSNQAKNTALWELCGVEGWVDVEEHCYRPMDRLLARQKAIQQHLAKKHLQEGHLVLYDITSTYFEGAYADSDIVLFGYNRDGKKGHEQVVLGLLCNGQGCPVGVEVFAGNTQDAATVVNKIQQLRRDYGLQAVTFVGDRGMITQAKARELEQVEGLHTITALTHRQIVELLERQVIKAELFDEKQIMEVVDPEHPQQRYCLCRNPESAAREGATRQRLLDLTQAGLAKIAARKKKTAAARLGAQVGRLLARYKMGKFVEWETRDGRLQWHWKEEQITQEKLFDGCYIIRTDTPVGQMSADQVVSSYKSLSRVEQAFRTLKTVVLEIRPVYHKKDERILSHVFLCVLAYYLQWHLEQRLQPLFEQDGQGKRRQWTVDNVLQRLKAIRRQRVRANGVEFDQVTLPEEDQQRILDWLKVKL
ncbi:MAG TPA: IS1634 family transposase [Candidatus Competibacteraceae bacterium]|nr:IS1634 family transposase [Candidatus Competibacteraceae bacterium]